MRALAIIGSNRISDNSNTMKVANKVMNLLKDNLGCQLDTEYISFHDLKMEYCQGCISCFRKGFCPIDNKDGFDQLKNKMLDSDIIAIASPVYAASVSGSIKVFFDRISYWLHMMALVGKIGIPIVNASSNSVPETMSYLKKVMETLGLFIPCNIGCTTDVPNMIDSKEFNNITLPNNVAKIQRYINGETYFASAYQEKYYSNLLKTYGNDASPNTVETEYWKNEFFEGIKTCTDLMNVYREEKDVYKKLRKGLI